MCVCAYMHTLYPGVRIERARERGSGVLALAGAPYARRTVRLAAMTPRVPLWRTREAEEKRHMLKERAYSRGTKSRRVPYPSVAPQGERITGGE